MMISLFRFSNIPSPGDQNKELTSDILDPPNNFVGTFRNTFLPNRASIHFAPTISLFHLQSLVEIFGRVYNFPFVNPKIVVHPNS
jgi:hypothetical protein